MLVQCVEGTHHRYLQVNEDMETATRTSLDSLERQNIATMLAIHSPQLILEHPLRQEHPWRTKSKGREKVSISQNRIADHVDQIRTAGDTTTASKRSKPRLLTNVITLEDTSKWVQEVDVLDDEVAPEKYD